MRFSRQERRAFLGIGLGLGIWRSNAASAPSAPTGLASTGGPVFTWTASAGATSYIFYRSPHGANTYTKIQSGIPIVSTSDGTLLINNSYDYYVTAVNSGGESAPSNVYTLTGISGLTAYWLGTSGYQDSGATVPCTDQTLAYVCKDTMGSYNLTQSTTNNQPRFDATKGLLVCETQSPGVPVFTASSVPFDPQNGSIFFIAEQATTRRLAQTVGGAADDVRYYAMGDGQWGLVTCDAAVDGFPSGGIGNLSSQEVSGTFKPGSEPMPTSRSLFGFVGTASDGSIVVNGATTSITVSPSTSTTFASVLGYHGTGGTLFPSIAGMKASFVVNHALTAPELAYVRGYAAALGCPDDTTNRFIYAGDSITQGVAAPLNNGWVRQLGLSSKYTEFNVSQGGIELTTMAGDVATTVVPLLKAGRNNNVFLAAGTNDMVAGRSAAQIYADSQTWCNAAKTAKPCRIVIDGILPRSSGTEAVRQTTRTLFLADFSVATANPLLWAAGPGVAYADYYWDIAADTNMGSAGDNTNLLYFAADQTHPVTFGHAYVATLKAPVVDLLVSLPIPTPSSLLTAEMAHYSFTSLTADNTGNGNTLSNNNAVTQTTGILGQAANFDATLTQSLSITSNPFLQMGAGVHFSLSGWFHALTLPTVSAIYIPILAKWGISAPSAEYAVYLKYTSGAVNVAIQASDGTTVTELVSSVPITAGGTHFFCYTYDGTNLYVNVDGTIDQVAHTADIRTGTATFYIGRDQGILPGDFFTGWIDEVYLVKQAFSSTQQVNLRGGGTPPPYPYIGVP